MILGQPTIPTLRPRVLAALPHDRQASTQGLAWRLGELYESTGLYGRSTLRRMNAEGVVSEVTELAPELYGEDLAISGDRLVQLTWREHTALEYALPDLTSVTSLSYSGEGWGLTLWNEHWITSNGSNCLRVRDTRFDYVYSIDVRLRRSKLVGLNALACVEGLIYANVYRDSNIYVISPESGKVCSIVDCSELLGIARPSADSEMLNGIAFNEDLRVFYVTGKCWPYIFVVEIE